MYLWEYYVDGYVDGCGHLVWIIDWHVLWLIDTLRTFPMDEGMPWEFPMNDRHVVGVSCCLLTHHGRFLWMNCRLWLYHVSG